MRLAASRYASQGTRGFRCSTRLVFVYEAAASLLQGHVKAALPGLIRGLDAYRRTGAALALPYYFGLLGSALIGSKRLRDADNALNMALAVVEKSLDRCHEAELHRLKGELALCEGQSPAMAEDHFRRSIEIAKAQQSVAWELRSVTSLARLYRRQHRGSEAQERLSEALAKFTEGFATPDLQAASALLAELGTR